MGSHQELRGTVTENPNQVTYRRTLKRIVSENYGTAAAKVPAELIHREDPVSTKDGPTRTSQIQHPG